MEVCLLTNLTLFLQNPRARNPMNYVRTLDLEMYNATKFGGMLTTQSGVQVYIV